MDATPLSASDGCPVCGSPLSTPMFGRRTKLWRQTCHNTETCGRTFIVDAPVPVLNLEARQTFAFAFTPDTSRPPDPAPRPGAMERLATAQRTGKVREFLKGDRKQQQVFQMSDWRARRLGKDA